MSDEPLPPDLYIPAVDVIKGDLIVVNNAVWEVGRIHLAAPSQTYNTLALYRPGEVVGDLPHSGYCIPNATVRVRLHSPAPDPRRPLA